LNVQCAASSHTNPWFDHVVSCQCLSPISSDLTDVAAFVPVVLLLAVLADLMLLTSSFLGSSSFDCFPSKYQKYQITLRNTLDASHHEE
jgi:hypothetical protein